MRIMVDDTMNTGKLSAIVISNKFLVNERSLVEEVNILLVVILTPNLKFILFSITILFSSVLQTFMIMGGLPGC